MSNTNTRKILYAILSGLMLTASFPPGQTGWMAWIALIPLLFSIKDEPLKSSFKLGFITGFAHFLTLLYWIIFVLGYYGGMNIFVSTMILILFCCYLSLYIGLFAAITTRVKNNYLPAVTIAASWVAVELLRAKMLTGFPWCLLGYSQHHYSMLIQISDITGVYGLSFLISLVNVSLFFLLFNDSVNPGPLKKLATPDNIITVILLILILSYGNQRLSENQEVRSEKESLKVAIIQGNVDQSLKWSPEYRDETMEKYARLTRLVSHYRPGLIIWPETATPFFFQENNELRERVIRICRESKAHLIFGSPAYERSSGTITYYNRAYHITPEGKVTGYYDKIHLVPFGEYIPMSKLLSFIHRLVPAAGDFSPGKSLKPLHVDNLLVGTLICYESIFPELSRAHIKNGATVLVNLTNDAWFGMSSAPYQHLIMSKFRAIETRRNLIRAANTGFSAFIDDMGDITKRSDLFLEEILLEDIQIKTDYQTIYSRYGDLFAYLIVFAFLIVAIVNRRIKWKKQL
jgi:apolipoprotein N-acyltransferase